MNKNKFSQGLKNTTERKVFVPSKPWEPRKPEDAACWAVVDEMNARLGWLHDVAGAIHDDMSTECEWRNFSYPGRDAFYKGLVVRYDRAGELSSLPVRHTVREGGIVLEFPANRYMHPETSSREQAVESIYEYLCDTFAIEGVLPYPEHEMSALEKLSCTITTSRLIVSPEKPMRDLSRALDSVMDGSLAAAVAKSPRQAWANLSKRQVRKNHIIPLNDLWEALSLTDTFSTCRTIYETVSTMRNTEAGATLSKSLGSLNYSAEFLSDEVLSFMENASAGALRNACSLCYLYNITMKRNKYRQ